MLEDIKTPDDIKQYSNQELETLAAEIRSFLVQSVSETGGHFASNLGVVELTLALHSILESPKDKIVWDVGHQAYVHKILTGRKNQFGSLRQYGGLSGFPKRTESEHDAFETGHSSTSISAALGMARAREINQDDYQVVAVIGDGALTGGMAFEALNDAGQSKTNLTVILNDNQMSIAKNVGAISSHLLSIRTNKAYLTVKHEVEDFLCSIPKVGKITAKAIERFKNTLKYNLVQGVLFEEMGFTYIGPIDGHNMPLLKKAIKQAVETNGPTIVHVRTQKGKGYRKSENFPTKYHAMAPPKRKSDLIPLPSYSSVFGSSLCELAQKDQRVVAITAAMPDGTGLTTFRDRFPKRFYDVGIAEQHAVTMAAGMACQGIKPYVALYSTFAQRAYDQIVHDVCMQNLPVTLCIDRAGLVGEDGPTHHGVFDLSFFMHMPNMTVLAPADINELKRMMEFSRTYNAPLAIRYPKGSYCLPSDAQKSENIMEWEELYTGSGKVVIIATGRMVKTAIEVKTVISEIDITVVNAHCIKPLDERKLEKLFNEYEYIISFEDNAILGGLGSAIDSWKNNRDICAKFKSFGIEDKFITHGKVDQLFAELNLRPQQLAKQIEQLIN